LGREPLELDLVDLLEPDEPGDERLERFDDLPGKGMPRPPEERRLD
jgi:hypothetical protein